MAERRQEKTFQAQNLECFFLPKGTETCAGGAKTGLARLRQNASHEAMAYKIMEGLK